MNCFSLLHLTYHVVGILLAFYKGHASILTLLDFSAAFDTIGHEIFYELLCVKFIFPALFIFIKQNIVAFHDVRIYF